MLGAVLGEIGYNGGLCPSGASVAVGRGGEAVNTHSSAVITSGIVWTAREPHPVNLKALKKDPVLYYSLYEHH